MMEKRPRTHHHCATPLKTSVGRAKEDFAPSPPTAHGSISSSRKKNPLSPIISKMNALYLLALLVALASSLLVSARPAATLVNVDNQRVIPGEFIVMYKDQDQAASSLAQAQWADQLTNQLLALAAVPEAALLQRYENGFAARMSDEALEAVRAHPEVDFVEPNQIVSIHAVQNNPPSWGLARIYQREFRVRNIYKYQDTAGENVDVR